MFASFVEFSFNSLWLFSFLFLFYSQRKKNDFSLSVASLPARERTKQENTSMRGDYRSAGVNSCRSFFSPRQPVTSYQ